MGKLIIDGNNVFEIDEDCIKNNQIPDDCNIKQYLNYPNIVDDTKLKLEK